MSNLGFLSIGPRHAIDDAPRPRITNNRRKSSRSQRSHESVNDTAETLPPEGKTSLVEALRDSQLQMFESATRVNARVNDLEESLKQLRKEVSDLQHRLLEMRSGDDSDNDHEPLIYPQEEVGKHEAAPPIIAPPLQPPPIIAPPPIAPPPIAPPPIAPPTRPKIEVPPVETPPFEQLLKAIKDHGQSKRDKLDADAELRCIAWRQHKAGLEKPHDSGEGGEPTGDSPLT